VHISPFSSGSKFGKVQAAAKFLHQFSPVPSVQHFGAHRYTRKPPSAKYAKATSLLTLAPPKKEYSRVGQSLQLSDPQL
jgi:hypothetical protein